MVKKFFILFCVLTALGEGKSQDQLLTPELLWKIPRVALETVSPDGQSIVYAVQRYDVSSNTGSRVLMLMDLKDRQTLAFTDPNKTCSDASFTVDGARIGYLQDGIMFEYDLRTKETKQVSDLTMNGFRYAPNGSSFLLIRDVKLDKTPTENYPDLPKSSARIADGLLYRHWKSWHDYAYSQVFSASYNEGKLHSVRNLMKEPYDSPLAPMGGIEQTAWAPNSKSLVYTCRKLKGTAEAQSTNSDLYVFMQRNENTLCITEGLPGYDLDPIFSPDGNYLVWTSLEKEGYEADRNRLMLLDTRTNQRIEITEDWTYEANGVAWASDSKSLFFISSEDFTQQIYEYTLSTKKIRRVTSGLFDYSDLKMAGNQLIATRVSMTAPAEVYAVNTQNGMATALTNETAAFWDPLAKAKVERRSVKTFDGKNMNVWMVLPPNFDPQKKYPSLLYCQGGPQSILSQGFSYRWNISLMAAKGYVVIAPCRRGMPGAGEAWNDAIIGHWGDAMKDLLSATDAAAKEPFIDPARMGAVGASFGGYAVYWLAGNHQKRFKAFISHCGLFNLESFYGTTEEVWFPQNDFEGPYWQQPQPKMYKEDSPHLYVQNWDTPILVIHNDLDFRVPISEGMQAFQAAQLRGIPSRFLMFPDEGHWISKPQNSLLWQREFFGWLDKYLK